MGCVDPVEHEGACLVRARQARAVRGARRMGGGEATGGVLRPRSALPGDGSAAPGVGGARHWPLGRRARQRALAGDGRRVRHRALRRSASARIRAARSARRQCAGDVDADPQRPRRARRLCGSAHGGLRDAWRDGGSPRRANTTAARRWPRAGAARGLHHREEPGQGMARGRSAGPSRRGHAATRPADRRRSASPPSRWRSSCSRAPASGSLGTSCCRSS